MASGVAAFAVSFAFTGMGQQFVWLLVGIGCVVAATVVGVVARRRQPRVELDASRRWVTLWGVHPDFADSYRRTRSDSRESMSASDLSDR